MFRELLTLDEAKRVIRRKLKTKVLSTEEVSLLEGVNRVLESDVVVPVDVPGFDRSTVDGYAVRAANTFGAEESKPISLTICGLVNIGEKPLVTVSARNAVEIVTGAPIPVGADAVVMVEHTERVDDCVRIYRSVVKDDNIMKAGSDLKKGEVALRAGSALGSREVGVLAACGLAKIRVFRKPKVGVFSTGGELVEAGLRLGFGKIWDINAYALCSAVLECGGEPVFLGVFPDDKKIIADALKHAVSSCDLVVSSGGVSVGPKDFMPEMLGSLGEVVVCGIAVKPGKPTTVAVVDGKPVFALPGHPASAFLVFDLLVRPLIENTGGLKSVESVRVDAISGVRMFAAKGRRTFVMVKLRRDRNKRLVAIFASAGLSGAITTIAGAEKTFRSHRRF